ncbi:MAG: hypothetical protein ACR2OR_07825 [Hyphomicrobiales bacterium]
MTGLVLLLYAPLAEAGPNCKCRYNGVKYALGEVTCIRGKLSKCELNLNNTSWKVLSDICPQARSRPPQNTPRVDIAGVVKN